MKNYKLLSKVLLLISVAFVSCGPPEEFEKGMTELSNKRFCKAIGEFQRIDAEDKEWQDSGKARIKQCFVGLIKSEKWEDFEEACKMMKDDKKFVGGMQQSLVDYILKKGESDTMSYVFDLLDDKENGLSDAIKKKIGDQYVSSVLTGYVWKGQGELSGHQVYFKWVDPKDGKEGDKKLHGYSNKYINSWGKDMLIYMNIRYSKKGKFSLAPRTWRWGRSSFKGNWGTMTIVSKEKIKIYYGGFSYSNSFKRGDKRS
jgi:hypothetical protein